MTSQQTPAAGIPAPQTLSLADLQERADHIIGQLQAVVQQLATILRGAGDDLPQP